VIRHPRLKTLLNISRPRFWLYTAGPFLLGYLAGLPSGGRNLLIPAFWMPFLYFLIPANCLLYGINDLFDAETDSINQKKVLQENLLIDRDRRSVIVLVAVSAGLSVGLLLLLPIGMWGIFILFCVLSVVYSAPPIRLKARPFWDSYSNSLYVLPGFLGFMLTAQQLPSPGIAIASMCWAAGMHAISAIPDIQPDREAQIETIAVRLGHRTTLIFVGLNWLIFALLLIFSVGRVGCLALVYPMLPAILYFFPENTLDHVYWWFPLLNGAMGFLVFLMLTR
jgi:4-hydroxybenzoate polyprenyltransferase